MKNTQHKTAKAVALIASALIASTSVKAGEMRDFPDSFTGMTTTHFVSTAESSRINRLYFLITRYGASVTFAVTPVRPGLVDCHRHRVSIKDANGDIRPPLDTRQSGNACRITIDWGAFAGEFSVRVPMLGEGYRYGTFDGSSMDFSRLTDQGATQ